jgi:hypothetical protein
MSARKVAEVAENAPKSDTDEGSTSTEDGEDEKYSSSDSGSSSTGGDLEEHIRRVVESVVDGLFGDRDKDVKSTPAQDEHAIRKMVRDAQTDLKTQEEKDYRFESVAESVESLKKAVEKAPARAGVGGKIQTWLWGESE